MQTTKRKENDYEETIVKLLKAQRRPLPIFRISRKTDMSWPTTRKYLKNLALKGTVKKKKKGTKILWET